MNMKRLCFIGFFLFVSALVSNADVTLPSIIGSNMVLQQKSTSSIWGKADSGELVSVKGSWDCAIEKTTVADGAGHWVVEIQTPSAGGPFRLVIKGNNTLELKNVMSGEVWVAGGQSNMYMPLKGFTELEQVDGSAEEIEAANFPHIRLFNINPDEVAFDLLENPQFSCPGTWQLCSPETVSNFSAIAYIFGKEIHKETHVPVGIIQASVDGTYLEAWIESSDIEKDAEFREINSTFDTKKALWIEQHPNMELSYMLLDFQRSGRLFNGIIAPLIPFTIKGAIWYQGESNAGRGEQYQRLFPALIQSWRTRWGQGDFPFYFVQLANFNGKSPNMEITYKKPATPEAHPWAELREAQFMTLALTNTGMAVAIDLGEANKIHPANKIDVGKRLSRWALAKDYGKKVSFSGPFYKSMKIEGEKIRLSFNHTDGGLLAKGAKLEGFAVAGANQQFVWADAVIEGDTVVVSNPAIGSPVAVRYAWEFFPLCNLYNGAGLPASPFRTDHWVLFSHGIVF